MVLNVRSPPLLQSLDLNRDPSPSLGSRLLERRISTQNKHDNPYWSRNQPVSLNLTSFRSSDRSRLIDTIFWNRDERYDNLEPLLHSRKGKTSFFCRPQSKF